MKKKKTLTQYKIFIYKRYKIPNELFFKIRPYLEDLGKEQQGVSVSFSLCFLNQLALLSSIEMLENPLVPRSTAFVVSMPWTTSRLSLRAEGRGPSVFCHRNATTLMPWTS